LAIETYKVIKKFPKSEAYGLISQIQRSAVSIPANIAEGHERNHRKEYSQHLFVAKGSLGELETHLLLARGLDYLSEEEYGSIEKIRKEAAKILVGLIKSLSWQERGSNSIHLGLLVTGPRQLVPELT
jgi:four helix bundle protein